MAELGVPRVSQLSNHYQTALPQGGAPVGKRSRNRGLAAPANPLQGSFQADVSCAVRAVSCLWFPARPKAGGSCRRVAWQKGNRETATATVLITSTSPLLQMSHNNNKDDRCVATTTTTTV